MLDLGSLLANCELMMVWEKKFRIVELVLVHVFPVQDDGASY
jgi:hypothetical protein